MESTHKLEREPQSAGEISDARSRTRRLARHPLLIALVLALVIVLIQAPSLQKYPIVHVDEPWNADRAWHRLQTADNTTTIDVGPWPDGRGIGTPPIASALLMWSYKLLGLGLWQTRLPALLFGIVLLLATYWVGKRLYNARTGLLALALLGVSPFFLLSSHLGRPDIVLAAFIALALSCVVVGQQAERPALHLVAGFIASLSFEVHQNALLFVPALLLCYVVYGGRRFWKQRGLWLFLLGGALGCLVYGTFIGFVRSGLARLIPGMITPGYVQWTVHGAAGTHKPPIANPTALRLMQSLLAEIWFRFQPRENALALALIGAALLFLAWRRTKSDRVLLAFVGTAFVLFVLLVQNKVDHYTILIYPYLMLALAAAFTGFLDRKPSRPWRAVLSALLVLMLLSSAARNVLVVYENRHYDYYAVTDRIREAVPQGSRIMARPVLWLGLHDYEFRSTFTLTDYHYIQGYTLEQGIEAFRPDYIIVEDGLRRVLVDSGFAPAGGEGKAMLNLPRQDFEQFLQRQGQKVLEFDNPWHGPVEVYRIAW